MHARLAAITALIVILSSQSSPAQAAVRSSWRVSREALANPLVTVRAGSDIRCSGHQFDCLRLGFSTR